MALERPHVSVLRLGSRADAALAQIDFLKAVARGRGVEIEQRALRQREADRAVDVALHQFVTALEPLIEAFEHAPGQLAGLVGAFQRDVIAARSGNDAEPALDQSEILAVLTEQGGGEAIVVEGERDLRRVVLRDDDRLVRSGCSQFRLLRRARLAVAVVQVFARARRTDCCWTLR